jgi:ankyrin repeat protein
VLAATDNPEGVRLLLQAGVDATSHRNENQRTLLMFSAAHWTPRVTQAFVDGGLPLDTQDEAGWTALMFAVYRNDLETTEIFLQAGADVNLVTNMGASALHAAVNFLSGLEIVDALLSAGADTNNLARCGTPIIGMAAAVATPEVLQSLILAGAELEAVDQGGLTPLMLAWQYRNLDNAQVLLDAGAAPKSHADLHARRGKLDA